MSQHPHPSIAEQLDEFDPNVRPQVTYATFCIRRTAPFKLHRTKGAAKAAITQHAGGGVILYKWDSDTELWVEVERAGGMPSECDGCGASTMRTYGGVGYNHGRWAWLKDARGRNTERLWFGCQDCRFHGPKRVLAP